MSDLVRSKLSQSLGVKTLSDLVRAKASESVTLLIDVSGSMDATMRNGKTRHRGLCEVVSTIQKEREVKMIAFGGVDDGAYEVSSIPSPGGGTPLHRGIDLAREKGCGRAIVISDGCPDSTTMALESAKTFGGRIDVVFVGNPGDFGEDFLRKLAEATGGTEFHGDLSEPKQLGNRIAGLLGNGSDDDEED